jgi:two-component system LytT family response regulator
VSARVRALVVDDEAPARALLRSLLAGHPEVEVVGEAVSGVEAAALIASLRPELVFLDVQMPGLNGFEVIEAVSPARMPAVVFVSAYDEYALRAFEVHALDYLLKPFDRARLARALDHAIAQLRGSDAMLGARLESLLEHLHARRAYPERIAVRFETRTLLVDLATIDWMEAANKQVRLHAGEKVYEVRATMRALEEELDPQRFVRIHRSTIVNVARIRELQPWFQGTRVLILHDGTRLFSGPGYEANLRRIVASAALG